MKIVVAQILQILGQPLSVREHSALRDLCVKCRPTPPAKHIVWTDATVMKLSNRGAVVIELRMVVASGSKHHAL
jgi:hypothetical protein